MRKLQSRYHGTTFVDICYYRNRLQHSHSLHNLLSISQSVSRSGHSHFMSHLHKPHSLMLRDYHPFLHHIHFTNSNINTNIHRRQYSQHASHDHNLQHVSTMNHDHDHASINPDSGYNKDLEDLYSYLAAPAATNPDIMAIPNGDSNNISDSNTPITSVYSKLDPLYLHNLKLSYIDSTRIKRKRIETLYHDTLSSSNISIPDSDSFSSSFPSLASISKIIHLNALARRPRQAQEAFDLLLSSDKYAPNLLAYQHLLDAYASVGDLVKALEVFKDLKSRHHLVPDEVTFGILISIYVFINYTIFYCLTLNHSSLLYFYIYIEACVNAKNLRAAFKVYESMKLKPYKFSPGLPIYTTLIKGCIASGDIERAWKTFEFMRMEICEPDSVLYSLMIHGK